MDELDELELMLNNSPDSSKQQNEELENQMNHYDGLMQELEKQETYDADELFQSDTINNNDYLPDDFAHGFSEVEDTNDLQAELQPWSHKAGAFVGRTAGKAVIEFTKGLGYLGGIPGAVATGEIENMTNNFFIDLLDSADEQLKESLPVYVKNAVKEGNLGTKLMSMDFWANEGADGLGFLISSIGMGGVLSKLGQLAKLSNTVNLALTSGVQTIVEAAAETSGMSTQLDQYWEERRQPDGTYLDGNNNPISAEQVKQKKAEALHSTFIQNSILLAGPNLVMANNLFGKPNPIKNMLGISENSLSTIPKQTVTSLDEMIANLDKVNPWKEGLKGGGLEMLKVGSSEAFQELTQFAIEDYNSQLAKNLTNDDIISGLWNSYSKGISETDGQAAMALGFIFGAGASTIGSYKKYKADAKKQKGLSALLSTANDSYKTTLKSLYKVNEEGNYEIDNEKVADIIDSNIKDLTLDDRYKKARAMGEKDSARYALGHIVMRTLQPFLEQEEGMTMFDQLVEENSETYESDYADLGFKSVKEMKSYIESVAKTAQTEHQKFQEKGYHKFGINKKILYRGKENAQLIDEVYGRFLSSMNNLNQSLVFSRNRLLEEKTKVEQQLTEEQSKLIFPDLNPESETYEQDKTKALNDNKIISSLRSNLTQINQALNKINQDYEKLYDKDEHEKAFNQLYLSRHKMQEAAQEDLAEREQVEESVNNFYDNLKTKGYSLTADEGGNELPKGVVSLLDNQGNVYLVGKGKLNGKSDKYIIRNVNTNEVQEFTAQLMKDKFPTIDNILSKEQFKDWQKSRKVINKYEKAVKAINEFIGPVSGGRMEQIINQRKKIFEQQESLDFYNEYLKGLKQEAPSRIRSLEDITNEIAIVEEEISKLESSISELNERLELLEESLELIQDIELEYLEGISNFNPEAVDKPMTNMLNQLQEQFENDEISESIDLIENSIKLSNEILDDLYEQQSFLNDLLNDLYYTLTNNVHLNKLVSELSDEQIKMLEDALDVTSEEIRSMDVFDNSGKRIQALKILKANKGDLWHSYNLIKSELNTVVKDINRFNKAIDNLNKNKKIRKQYDQLSKDIVSLNAIFRNIKLQEKVENFTKHYGQGSLPTQSDLSHANDYKSKASPYSSTTSVYKFENGDVVLDDNDNKVKSNNWKQAVRWSKSMMDVDLNNIGDYHLEFVNNAGLEKLGITPLSQNEDDLYVILNKNGEAVIVDGEIAFTGIAFPSTYFDNNQNRINLSKNPDYLNAKVIQNKVDNGKLDKFEYVKDGVNYNTLQELESHLKNEMKNEYSDWRSGILSKLKSGNRLYTPITHVSKGHPIISTKKNKVKEVFGKIDKIIIPGSSTYRTNTTSFDVAPGMVHVQDEKGHVKRVLNRRIDSLPDSEQKKMLDTILKFIALSAFTENSVTEEFNWNNSKSRIKLLGNNKSPGILDYYINWGDSNKNWAINIGRNKKTGVLQVRITNGVNDASGKPVATFIDIDTLFDGKISPENIRKSDDPVLKPLTDFLKTKYLNVSRQSINKELKYGFWLPTDWKIVNKQPVIIGEKKKWKTYNDYVLDKIVYTNVEKYNKSIDEIPNFVNQYAVFDKDDISDNKLVTASVEPVVPKETLTSSRENNPDTNFNADVIAEAFEAARQTETTSVFGDDGTLDTAFANMIADKQEKKEDETHCASPKKKGNVAPPKAPPGIKINKFKGEIL